MVPGLRIPPSENAEIVWTEVWIWGLERTGSLLISSAMTSLFMSLRQDLTSCWSQSGLHSQPFKNDHAYALLPQKPSSPLRSPTSYNHLIFHLFSFATGRNPRIGKDEERLFPSPVLLWTRRLVVSEWALFPRGKKYCADESSQALTLCQAATRDSCKTRGSRKTT